VAVIISVRLYPNATKNEVVGFSDEVWQVRVAAPPVKGEANKEVISFLSKVLGVSKSSVSIARGHTNRNKLIAIDMLTREEIMKRLSASVSSR